MTRVSLCQEVFNESERGGGCLQQAPLGLLVHLLKRAGCKRTHHARQDTHQPVTDAKAPSHDSEREKQPERLTAQILPPNRGRRHPWAPIRWFRCSPVAGSPAPVQDPGVYSH